MSLAKNIAVLYFGLFAIIFWGALETVGISPRLLQAGFIIASFAAVARTGLTRFQLTASLCFLLYFIATLILRESPAFGAFLYLSAYLVGSNCRHELLSSISGQTIIVGIALMNVLSGIFFFSHDRIMFVGGDPNYTALFFCLVLSVLISRKRRIWSMALTLIICALIIGTFSRTGILCLFVLLLLKGFRPAYNSLSRTSFFPLFMATQIFSIGLSALVLFVVYQSSAPEYVQFQGISRLSFDNLLDVSNFIRLNSTLFFVQESNLDVLWVGARSENLQAFVFEGKYIRPHHFLSALLFEFGVVGSLLILLLLSQFRKSVDPYSSVPLIVFGAAVGFGSYYGFVFAFFFAANAQAKSIAADTLDDAVRHS